MKNSSPYPAPAGITTSSRYAVTVNGESSCTYLTTSPKEAEFTAGHTASWTSYDLRGPCEIRIRRMGRPPTWPVAIFPTVAVEEKETT